VFILEEEKKLLLSILELEESKKEALIDRNLDKLIEINDKEQRIFEDINKYEVSRYEIIKKLQERFKLDNSITLSDLLPFLKDKGKLEVLKGEVIEIVEKIKSLSFENRILIESAMNVSMEIIENFTNTKQINLGYDKKGRKEMKVDFNTYSTIG
ncbi:MAG: flagellar export chaperone FlgN, partial [Brevinematia bacterium]